VLLNKEDLYCIQPFKCSAQHSGLKSSVNSAFQGSRLKPLVVHMVLQHCIPSPTLIYVRELSFQEEVVNCAN